MEAAELEDMNPDDGINGWDPLISAVEPEGSGSLVERFPLYSSEADMREIVHHLAIAMEKGTTINDRSRLIGIGAENKIK